MLARDMMRKKVATVREDTPVDDVLDLLVDQHFHGAPVVDADGKLVGIISQQDIYFAGLSRPKSGGAKAKRKVVRAADIMTSPAVSATEETDLESLCQMMHKLRIHRVPILRDEKLTGIISSLDICGAVGRGEKLTS